MSQTGRRTWRIGAMAMAIAVAGGGLVAGWAGGFGRPDARPPAAAAAAPEQATASAGAPARAPLGASPQPAPAKRDRDRVLRQARATIRDDDRAARAIRAVKGEKYQARDVILDRDGASHVRFDRTYRGLPVLGGDYVLHSGPDGTFRQATVAQSAPISVSTEPSVGRAKAISVATAKFRGKRGRATADLVVDAADGAPRLAWQVVVEGVARGGLPSRLHVIVDARTGTVRRTFDGVESAEAGTGHGLHVGDVSLSTRRHADGYYELIDPARGAGETRDGRSQEDPTRESSLPLTDADNVWGDGKRTDPMTVAADVHYGVQNTWDYFRDVHGRTGIRNDGKGATAFVHYKLDEGNAAWSQYCFCMYFGDGKDAVQPFTQLDVVGHEMSHGVNRATANLQNTGESHGLNESNSDIFGTLAEFHANNPVDPPDYLIGEKTNTNSNGTPLRWMDRPARDGLSVSCWYPELRIRDGHYSSGVGNKFFYTLAVGSGKSAWGDSPTCNGAPPVTGIGNDKAGRIWYRALTTYMVSTTDYAKARLATLSAATDLFGADSAEYAAVDGAWKAAAVDGSTQAPSQYPTIVDPGELVVNEGDEVRIQLVATDPQNDELTFAPVWSLPPGLSMSPSGLITGRPELERRYITPIRVSDPLGHSAELDLVWRIYTAPYVRDPGPQTGTVGQPVRLQIVARDLRYPITGYSATGLPAGLSIDPQTGLVSGTPSAAGSATATVSAVNSSGGRQSVSFTWTIGQAAPGAPTAVSVVGGSAVATVTWQPPADPGGSPITGYVVHSGTASPVTLPVDARSVVLRGLAGNIQHRITVQAVSAVGNGTAAVVVLSGVASTVNAAPASVAHGGTVTLSGKLTRVGGRAAAGQTVRLQHRPAGQQAWTPVATVVTTGTGTWSRTVRPVANTAYRTVYGGAQGLLGSVSAARTVPVTYAVTVAVSSTKPKAGAKVRITGTEKPARVNTKVTLQRLVGTKWVAVAAARTKANGTYVFSRTFKRGTWTLRVVAAGGTVNGTGVSRKVKLTVR